MVCTYTLALQDARQQRQDIGGSLSRTAVSLCENILTVESKRNGLALHKSRLRELLLRDGLEKSRIKTKIHEGSLFLLLLLRRLFYLRLNRLLGGFRLFSLIALSLCGSHLGFEGVEIVVRRWWRNCRFLSETSIIFLGFSALFPPNFQLTEGQL